MFLSSSTLRSHSQCHKYFISLYIMLHKTIFSFSSDLFCEKSVLCDIMKWKTFIYAGRVKMRDKEFWEQKRRQKWVMHSRTRCTHLRKSSKTFCKYQRNSVSSRELSTEQIVMNFPPSLSRRLFSSFVCRIIDFAPTNVYTQMNLSFFVSNRIVMRITSNLHSWACTKIQDLLICSTEIDFVFVLPRL